VITEYPRLSGTHLVLIFGQVVRGVEDLQHLLYVFGGTVVARVQYHVERLDGTVLPVGVVPTDVQMTVVQSVLAVDHFVRQIGRRSRYCNRSVVTFAKLRNSLPCSAMTTSALTSSP
jgi:hypothetical protein